MNIPNAEPQLIDPGPFGGEALEEPAQDPAVSPPAAPEGDVTAPAPTIYQGIQKSFTTVEDLGAYTLELERQTLEQQARLEVLKGVPSESEPVAPTTGLNYKALGEEFIISPESAVQKIIQHVQGAVMGSVTQNASRAEFFRSFYEAHEDLIGCEELVDASVAKNSPTWSKLPMEQASKLLAADVRARAARIRGSAAAPGSIELSARPAHALAGGGSPAPRVQAPKPAAPLSFTAQLLAAKAKHRRGA